MTPRTYGRARDLFARARRLPRDGRTVWLRRACGSRASLVAEVRSLLDQGADRGRSSLGSPTTRAGSTGPQPDAAQVDGYDLIRPIGQGATCAVYLARQHHPLRRVVALKLITRESDGRPARARLGAEIRALAATDHPNVVRLFDAGAARDGRPYLVMQYVSGPSVAQFCDAGAYPIRRRLELFLQACEAVRHAHERGIVHRDVNPSNLIVSLHGQAPHVTLIGFGSATFMSATLDGADDARAAEPTRYTAPEQAAHCLRGADPRGDTFALGAVLGDLLGRSAGNPWAQVARRATDPNLTGRYQTVSQLVADVRAHLRHRPLLARLWSGGRE